MRLELRGLRGLDLLVVRADSLRYLLYNNLWLGGHQSLTNSPRNICSLVSLWVSGVVITSAS